MPLFPFQNHAAATESYTLSLHDALPISVRDRLRRGRPPAASRAGAAGRALESAAAPRARNRALRPRVGQSPGGAARAEGQHQDRKSTRLNSSHGYISYAVFCLKKKSTDV